ncbi:MAG: phospholipid carrier-dependent glycosyltransferase [Pirellulales bacterium]|nr:phospholipid carrier-dependent glycosyltransferase [Pirellulales bacterium]
MRWGAVLLMSLPLLARVVVFADHFGGVAQDSGWYLGVAKNLAHRGIYASYSNAIPEEPPGAWESILGRMNVQDAAGFTYFPAGVTVGPGYVVPEAMVLSLFGDGWWQYRLWPLLTYWGMLVVLLWLAVRMGGIASAALLCLWFWFVPQLSITTAYEAYSEPAALFWLLLSVACYDRARRGGPRAGFFYGAAGVLLSLATLTKALAMLAAPVFFLAALVELRAGRRRLRLWITDWVLFAVGFLVPNATFSLYRYVVLVFWLGDSRLDVSLDSLLWSVVTGLVVFSLAVLVMNRWNPARSGLCAGAMAILMATVAALGVLGVRMESLGDIQVDRRLLQASRDEHYQFFVSSGSGATRVCEIRDALKTELLAGGSLPRTARAVASALRPEAVLQKAAVLSDVGLGSARPSWSTAVPWIVLLILPWGFRRSAQTGAIAWLVLGLTCASQAWYLLLSETGWTRHAFLGLLPHMLLCCCLPAILWRLADGGWRRWLVPPATVAVLAACLNSAAMHPVFSLDAGWVDRLYSQREARGMEGLPSTHVIPLEDQRQLVAFFAEHIRPNDRMYYKGIFYVSEASTLVDKVFFPLGRYRHLGGRNPLGGNSYLILGPYQRGKLALVGLGSDPADDEIEASGKLVLENASYALLRLP